MKKRESDNEKRIEVVIIGYVIPDLTKEQAELEKPLHPMPVFSSEKGVYKKDLIYPTMDKATAAIQKRYLDE